MSRSSLTVVVLLAVVVLGTLFIVADPLGLTGGGRSAEEEAAEDLAIGTGPRLQGREKPQPGKLPKDVNGEPVGVLKLTLGSGTLTGQVTGAGEPILLARVEIVLPAPLPPAAVRTKEEGRFEIQGLPAGTFDLRATAEGWRGRTVTAPALAEKQTVSVPPIDLVRRPPMDDGIEVKVTDLEGRPLPGASVLATTIQWDLHLAIGPEMAGIRGVVSKTGQSDEDGVARLAPMPAQTYAVAVTKAGHVTVAWDRVVVARGRVEKLTARLAPGVSIQGRVVDKDGAGVKDATVLGFHQPSFMSSVAVRTAADGTFSLDGLRQGRYWVMAFEDNHGRGQANPVVSPSQGTTIKLGGVGWIEGKVTDAQDKPLSGVTLRPFSSEPFGYVYSRVIKAQADGTFRTAVTPGAWTVDAWSESGALSQGTKVKVEQDATATVAIRIAETGAVKGVVTDTQGNHIEGAEVFVRMGGFPPGPSREQYARTDADGAFDVRGLPFEQVKLHVRHAKYADATWEGTPKPAGQATPVTLRMASGARIVGRVLRADGSPVAGEQVNLFQNWFEPKTAFCDAQGQFTFDPVAAGTWQVSTGIFENGAPGQVKTGIVVGTEGTVQVDFGVATGTGTLTGRVTVSGKPAAGATLRVVDGRGEANQKMATADANGAFKVEGLEVGDLRVYVQTVDGNNVVRTVDLDATTLTARLDVALGTSSVRGRIVKQDGEPITGAWVSLEILTEDSDVFSRIKAQKTSATDGTFEAKGLEPGTYLVRVSSGEYAQHLGEPFALADGESKDVGDIRLAAGATLSGRVTDDTGKPVEDATISLKDSRGRPVFSFSLATSGSDGRYDVHGLAAGTYTVRFEAKGLAPDERPVTVGASGGTMDGVLSRGGTLVVTVEDGAGLPLAGAKVTLLDAKGQAVTRTLSLVNIFDGDRSVTDAQGVATLTDLAPGSYRLKAAKEGFAASEEVTAGVTSGGSARIRVTLSAPR
jgi:protocatechuate 3,4-dioxygenase beta subunit